ncbi:MAG: serine protease, partial [Pseudomonadota bacterium]
MRLTNSNRFRPLCRVLLAALTGLLATASFAQTVDPSPADLRLVPQSEAQIKLSFAPVAKQVAPA